MNNDPDGVLQARQALAKIDTPGNDDASLAFYWDIVRDCSVTALRELDVTVIDCDREDEIEDMPDPPVMGWASVPEDVIDWCRGAGLPITWAFKGQRIRLAVAFDGKPGADVIASLKAAGFSYDKPSRRWMHGLWGTSQKCVEKRLNELDPEQVEAEGWRQVAS